MKQRRNYGTGSIYPNKRTGGYTGQYMFNGKPKYVYGATKREVEEKLQENLVNIRTKRYIESNDMTIMQLQSSIAIFVKVIGGDKIKIKIPIIV